MLWPNFLDLGREADYFTWTISSALRALRSHAPTASLRRLV